MRDSSRRDFFRLAGLTTIAGSATLLAACGGDDDSGGSKTTTASESARESDATILNAALDLEYTAIAAYGAGAALLRGRARGLARQFREQEREHAAALAHTVMELGQTPNKPKSEVEYRRGFPRLRTQADVLRFTIDLEHTAVAAYSDAVTKLVEPELRQTAGAINANEAEHISALLGLLGEPQAPDALVKGGNS